MARTLKEKVIDRLLSLYVVDRCHSEHSIEYVSETKLQKLIFYSERKLNRCRCKAFNYRFIKLKFPTFSPDLRTDLGTLSEYKMLNGPYFRESKKAQMILEDFQELFDKNSEIMDIINSQVDSKAPIPTERLVKNTKRLRWRDGVINDLKNGTPLLFPIKEARADCTFEIDKESLEDLAICLSPKVTEGMAEAFGEIRRGRRLTHAEVFG